MKKLVLAQKAEKQLQAIFQYLEAEWSERIRKEVAGKIYKNFELIESNNELFPNSFYNNELRKCVVSKQTTIFYKIRKKDIVVVSVFDTRQNPSKVAKIK
jgi:plasmid stabilization system protein ParE